MYMSKITTTTTQSRATERTAIDLTQVPEHLF